MEQKLAGNVSESGFKPTMWHAVESAVADSIAGQGNKDLKQCKTCYHKVCHSCGLGHLTPVQFKVDYKIVKSLQGLSGFGWDEGEQMVTVQPEVVGELSQLQMGSGMNNTEPESRANMCLWFKVQQSQVQC